MDGWMDGKNTDGWVLWLGIALRRGHGQEIAVFDLRAGLYAREAGGGRGLRVGGF